MKRKGSFARLLLAGAVVASNCLVAQAVTSQGEGPRPGPVNFDSPPANDEEAKAQLTRLVREDFPYWAGGPDNKLTIDEIGRLQRDPRLRGAQAAALGSLAMTLDWRAGRVDRVSFQDLLGLAQGKTIETATTRRFKRNVQETQTKLRDWVMEYSKEFKNLMGTVTPNGLSLWGQFNGPTVQSARQGQIGDCYWLSAVEAVTLKRPELIKRTIVQVGPDTFELRFEGRKEPMRVRVTEADISQFNVDTGGGCWLTALALGEARVRDESKKTNQFWRETPMGVLDAGGSQCHVLHMLTGHKYVPVNLKKSPERRIVRILEQANREDIPIGLASKDHTLSIKHFDPQTRRVIVLNPWGTSDSYRLPGSDQKVEMKDGFFEVSLEQLREHFISITAPRHLAKG